MQDNIKQTTEYQKTSKLDEINLILLLNFFLRNKLLISGLSLIFFIFACLYSLTLKRVWQGQFEIVLNTEENELSQLPFSDLAPLQQFVGFKQADDLKTEVEILQSPSILNPIYEFVISKKDPKEKLKLEEQYDEWVSKNLDVKLKEGTKVLNIQYRDQDIDLIIPVLKKITSSYQNYSGRNKKRSQELAEKFLNKQINLFKEKSSKSLKAAQSFAIEQDLVDYEELLNSKNLNNDISNNSIENSIENSNLFLPNIDLETKRVQAANEIRRINIQLKKINKMNNSEEIQYIGALIPGIAESGIPEILKEIEQNLVENRAKYTEEDINIITLKEQREMTIDLLKATAINYLKIYRLEAEAVMEAAMRPKGILVKYKELIREAQRDESTLISLENQLRITQLEKAMEEDPWELITNPTLLKGPVAPSRKLIGLFGLIIGFIFGSSLAFYRENKSGKIFNNLLLEDIFEVPIIEKLDINDISSDLEKILFISGYFKSCSGDSFSLVLLGNISDEKVMQFQESIKNNLPNDKNFKILSALSLYENQLSFDSNFLFVRPAKLKIYDLRKFKERIELLNFKFRGIILIED